MKESGESVKRVKPRNYRNETAAFLSIIPGAGNIFKGHWTTGIILLLISPVTVWMAIYFGEPSGGFSWYIPIIYVLLTAWIAYRVSDRRFKHRMNKSPK